MDRRCETGRIRDAPSLAPAPASRKHGMEPGRGQPPETWSQTTTPRHLPCMPPTISTGSASGSGLRGAPRPIMEHVAYLRAIARIGFHQSLGLGAIKVS